MGCPVRWTAWSGSSIRPTAPRTASTRRSARRASTTCAPTPSSTSSRAPSRVGGERKFRASEIEDVLDVVVQGSDERPREVEAAPARGRLRCDPRACPQDRRERQAAHVAEDLRRRRRRVHGHQGADAARGHADAVRPAEPRGLGHVHGVPDARTPSLRARLRREGAGRRGRPRDQRPRRLPRAARGGRGRGGPGGADRASRATAPSSRTSRTCSPSRTRSFVSTSRSPSGGRWTSTSGSSARTRSSSVFGCTFLVADARPRGPERLRARGLADRRRHRGRRAAAARLRVRLQADPRPAAEPDQPGRLQDDPGEPLAEDGARALPPDDAADAAGVADRGGGRSSPRRRWRSCSSR